MLNTGLFEKFAVKVLKNLKTIYLHKINVEFIK